jgi:hypothetical protein
MSVCQDKFRKVKENKQLNALSAIEITGFQLFIYYIEKLVSIFHDFSSAESILSIDCNEERNQ